MDPKTSVKRLNELRIELDEIDRDICELIEERFAVCCDIAREKRTAGLPLYAPSRENEVIGSCRSMCPKNADAAEDIYRGILRHSRLLQKSRFNLYLIGMPNCGKSKYAGKLGNMLERRSIDTDSIVMHDAHKTIDAVFDESGEACFRELEHAALVRAARIGRLVVATGGGILTYEPNLRILKNSGFTVFLDRSVDRLLNAKTRNRPLIREGAEAVRRLYSERHALYSAFSDLTVDPDAPDCAETIVEFFRARIGEEK